MKFRQAKKIISAYKDQPSIVIYDSRKGIFQIPVACISCNPKLRKARTVLLRHVKRLKKQSRFIFTLGSIEDTFHLIDIEVKVDTEAIKTKESPKTNIVSRPVRRKDNWFRKIKKACTDFLLKLKI